MEELQARHRKEQQDLQSKITQKKKNTSKKTRKGVNDECDALQRDLQERQQAELAIRSQNVIVDNVQALHVHDDGNEIRQVGPSEIPEQDNAGTGVEREVESKEVSKGAPAANSVPNVEERGKKPSRQKARLARRAAEQEAQAAQATKEAANLPDLRIKS
jgi:OTU domain-containing protein 6